MEITLSLLLFAFTCTIMAIVFRYAEQDFMAVASTLLAFALFTWVIWSRLPPQEKSNRLIEVILFSVFYLFVIGLIKYFKVFTDRPLGTK